MANSKDQPATLNDVVLQMRITNRLITAQLKSSGNMKQLELIALLSTTGANAKEIADVLDTTPGTVATSLQRLKKKKAKPDSAGEEGS